MNYQLFVDTLLYFAAERNYNIIIYKKVWKSRSRHMSWKPHYRVWITTEGLAQVVKFAYTLCDYWTIPIFWSSPSCHLLEKKWSPFRSTWSRRNWGFCLYVYVLCFVFMILDLSYCCFVTSNSKEWTNKWHNYRIIPMREN